MSGIVSDFTSALVHLMYGHRVNCGGPDFECSGKDVYLMIFND